MATRRILNISMCDYVYQRLGDQPNTERTWGLLREVIGQHLFRSDFVPVPFIESAAYYNQLFVFAKKPSFWSAIGLRPPTYKVIGNMDYLINRNESTWRPQFDLSPWNIADGQNFESEYGLRVQSNQQGVEKLIEFTAIHSHARGAQPPIVEAVMIQRNLLQDLESVNTLYVITDVVLASYVKLLVRIGNETVNLVYDRDIPIGFRYMKYRVRNDGTFIEEIPSSIKIHAYEAIWLEPLLQHIPAAQLWDNVRRRYRGAVRRRRSNLTIPPLLEGPGNISQAEEIAILERSVENVNTIFRALDVLQQLRSHDLNELPSQNQQSEARSVSMEALRGSNDEEEF